MRRATLLLLAAYLACAQTGRPPAASIHGVVRDAGTGAPVPDVWVQAALLQNPLAGGGAAIVRTGPRPPGGSSTDDKGLYSLTDLPYGPVLVSVRNPRFQTVSRRVELSAGQDMTLDFPFPATRPSPAASSTRTRSR
jgi:hypothetical protein